MRTIYAYADAYSSRKNSAYWTKYSFPFWWTDLVYVLAAISSMPVSRGDPGIRKALMYIRDDQCPEGTWKFPLLKDKSLASLARWLNFSLCRALKRCKD
nr:hypothetical protein [Candidatus Sigynarchaeum springense]